MENERIKSVQEIVSDAPEFCPITGLRKITSYMFDEGVVYGTDYPHDAYTLPTYDPEEKAFYRTRIDMDDDFRRHEESVCELDDLRDRCDFDAIKKFYGIIEEGDSHG